MSGPLVPIGTGQSPAFAQQGQVDWVSLSKSTFSISFDVLNRLSRAGVEPLTFMSGSAVCSSFVLKPDAQRKVYDAIQKLKGFPSYGELLWFGFGIRPILKDLANTESGLTCTALCAALTHSYGSFMTGQVLRELCQLNGADRSHMPSVPQFMKLADACAGALTSTKFPELINGFARLILPLSHRRVEIDYKPTTPEALATALEALARLSRQDSLSLTFTGGLDCAWILAIAEWLLLLTVELTDESGLVVYRTRTPCRGTCIQVVVISSTRERQSANSVMLSSRFIRLASGSPLITMDPFMASFMSKTPGFATSSSWETIFHDTFGDSVDELLQGRQKEMFGNLLHGLAYDPTSIYHSAGTSLLNLGWDWIQCLYLGCGDGKGSNFLHFIVRKFPELQPCLKGIDLDKPPTSTHMDFEEFKEDLSRGFLNQRGTYLVTATTIFVFLLLMASIKTHPDQDILPTSRGIKLLYNALKPFKGEALQRDTEQVETNSFLMNQPSFGPIESILVIFTGRESIDQIGDSVNAARSRGGVCVYSPLLKDLNMNTEQAQYLFVVPGRIELEGEEYEGVGDVEQDVSPTDENFDPSNLPLLSYSLVVQVTPRRDVLKAEYRANASPAINLSCGVGLVRLAIANAVYLSSMAGPKEADVARQLMASLRSLHQSELEGSCVGNLKSPHSAHSEPQYQYLSPKKYTLLHRHDCSRGVTRYELLQTDDWRMYLGCGARESVSGTFVLIQAEDSLEGIIHSLALYVRSRHRVNLLRDNPHIISITSPYAKRSPTVMVFGDCPAIKVRHPG